MMEVIIDYIMEPLPLVAGWATSDVTPRKSKHKKKLPLGFRSNKKVAQWQKQKKASKKGNRLHD